MVEREVPGFGLLARVPDLRQALERRPVRGIVADKLGMLIASGVLQAGDHLPGERELASAFGVSRETVRGAIQTLAAHGIVDVAQGARTRVATNDVSALKLGIMRMRDINRYDLDDVHATRLLIEREVVKLAAGNIDDETLVFLEYSLRQQAATKDDPVRFLICDREFHTAIYHASKNLLLAELVTDLYSYVMENRRRAMARPGAIEASYADHRTIVDALAARDGDAAVAAFGRHLDRIYDTTKSIMAEAEEPAMAGTGAGKMAVS